MMRCPRSVVVGLMVVALLAGCGPAPVSPAPTPARPAAPVSPAPTPAKPAAPVAPAPKEKTTIRITSGAVGAGYWGFHAAIAFLLEKHSSWLRAEVVPTKGTVEMVTFLLQGKSSLTGARLIEMRKVYEGVGEFKALGPRKDVQLITNQASSNFNAVVLAGSPIKAWTYADLKGKRIATREIGSGGATTLMPYLQVIGLDPVKDVKLLHGGLNDGISAVLDGTADVYASTTGHPAAAFEDMFATKPCRFVLFTKEVIDKVNKAGMDQVPEYVPANTYKGQTERVLAGSTFAYVTTRADVSDDIVYEVTRAWWDYMDERNELHAIVARFATVDNLKANEDVGFPYHRAALKYYREKGWFK